MKLFFISLMLLISPTLLHAETSYFLACQEGKVVNVFPFYNQKGINFKRGDLFEVPSQALRKQGDLIINDDNQGVCWSDTGETTCPLVVYYGNSGGSYLHGFVDLGLGCWFKANESIPIKSNTANKLLNVVGSILGVANDDIFGKYLDKKFVDVMCSEHPSTFAVAGNTFTDIKKEKVEVTARIAEEIRLQQIARDEQIRKDSEEKASQSEEKEAAKREEKRILEVYNQEQNNNFQTKKAPIINSEALLYKPQNERTMAEIKARIKYANQLEKSYLARGIDMRVTAEDRSDSSGIKKALLFHYILMDKSIAYNIVKDAGFRKTVRNLGFEQVYFVAVRSNHPELNSYVYYVHEQKLYRVWGDDEGLYID